MTRPARPDASSRATSSISQPASLWLSIAPLLFVLLWAGGYATAKIALEYSSPLTLLVLRFGLVLIIMVIALLLLRPPMPKRPIDWLHLAIVGFLLQAVYFGFSYIAFASGVGAGTLALLMSLQPIMVGLAAPRWSGELVGWTCWLGLLLGLLGVAIVIATRAGIEPPTAAGFGSAVIALAGITAASLWEKRFGLSHHPVTSNLIGYAAGLAAILPLALWLEGTSSSGLNLLHGVNWTWQFSAAICYLVVGNSVIAVGLLLSMIRAGEVSRVSALFYLVPPMAAIIAWLLIDEIIPLLAWPGIAIAAAGVFLATRR